MAAAGISTFRGKPGRFLEPQEYSVIYVGHYYRGLFNKKVRVLGLHLSYLLPQQASYLTDGAQGDG